MIQISDLEPEPTPESIEAALEAFHRGSPEAFDRLLDPVADGSSGLCGLLADMSSPVPYALPRPSISGYRIDHVLAAGGMGVVFAGEHAGTRRRVAVKVIRGGFGGSAPVDRLFRREVETLVRLRHPNIADLYDAGTTDEGSPFFAMELVEGGTLKDYMKLSGEVDMRTERGREAIRRFIDVCRAMNYAHQRGVIHCDLKPTNVMIASDGVPKVLDFGLSRLIDPDVTTIAAASSHQLVGTLSYMSPEQANGPIGDLDIRSDVYSLGVMLFELLCREMPYRISGSSIPAAIRTICETSPPRPASIRPALKGDLDAIVMKALEKSPDRRYQSAGELADDLERALQGAPIEARADRFYLLRRTLFRYRIQALVAVAFFSVLTAAASISTWFWYRANQEANRAHKVGNTAISTIGELMDEVYEVTTEMRNQPRKIDRLDQQLQRLTEVIEMDPELQFIRWKLLEMQGRLAETKGESSRSREIFQQILDSAPPDSEWSADAHLLICGLLSADEARPHYEAALQFDLNKHERCYLTKLYATALSNEGRYDEALEVLESTECFASDVKRRIVAGRVYYGLDQMALAAREFRHALAFARKKVKGNSRPYFHKYRLLLAQQAQAEFFQRIGRHDEAFAIAGEGRELSDLLLEAKPFHIPTMLTTSKIYSILCDDYLRRGQFEEAWEAGQQAALNAMRIHHMDRDILTWQFERAETGIRCARANAALGNLESAEYHAQMCLKHLQTVPLNRRPPEPEYHTLLAEYHLFLAEVQDALGAMDDAAENRREAASIFHWLKVLLPENAKIEASLVKSTLALAAAERARGQSDGEELIAFAQDALHNFRELCGDEEIAGQLEQLIEAERALTIQQHFAQSTRSASQTP